MVKSLVDEKIRLVESAPTSDDAHAMLGPVNEANEMFDGAARGS